MTELFDEIVAIGPIRDVCAGRVQHVRDVDVLVIFGSSVECPVLPSELLSDYFDLIDEPVLVISGKRSFLVGIRELTGVLAEHVGLPIATASRNMKKFKVYNSNISIIIGQKLEHIIISIFVEVYKLSLTLEIIGTAFKHRRAAILGASTIHRR